MPATPNQPKGRWICPPGHACDPEPAEKALIYPSGHACARESAAGTPIPPRQGIGRRKNTEILNKKIDNLQQVKNAAEEHFPVLVKKD